MGRGSFRNEKCPCGSDKKYKNCCLGKVLLQNNELLEKLDIQLKLLSISCENYDNGNEETAITIATQLRTLLYDGRSSSLFTKLKINDNKFLSSVNIDARSNLFPTTALVGMIMGKGEFTYKPKLVDLTTEYKMLQFKTWWTEEIIIMDYNRNEFSREDIVLSLANQDGGAHQDDNIERDYWELSKNGSIGYAKADNQTVKMVIGVNNSEGEIIKVSPCYASIRQIAYEVLETMKILSSKIMEESKLK